MDSIDVNKKFAESLDLDYPILSDPEKKAAKAFGVLSSRGFASRHTFYVDKDGKIFHIDRKVKAREDGQTALKILTDPKLQKK